MLLLKVTYCPGIVKHDSTRYVVVVDSRDEKNRPCIERTLFFYTHTYTRRPRLQVQYEYIHYLQTVCSTRSNGVVPAAGAQPDSKTCCFRANTTLVSIRIRRSDTKYSWYVHSRLQVQVLLESRTCESESRRRKSISAVVSILSTKPNE